MRHLQKKWESAVVERKKLEGSDEKKPRFTKLKNLKKNPKEKKEEEPEEELRLVNKPLCNFFKAYEIDAEKYKDPVILFDDKKSVLIEQINKDIQ